MSTRGLIGIPHDDGGFFGRYVHMDTYPTSLGRKLLASYAQLGDWQALIEHAVRPQALGYWSSYCEPDQEPLGWRETGEDPLMEHTNSGGLEWAYLLDERGIHVVTNESTGWESVTKIAWTDTEVDWGVIECGEDFERCNHYAYKHFPGAEGTRISTAVWLGRVQPGGHDAEAVLDPESGRRWELGGSGSTGTARDGSFGVWRTMGPRTPRYWWASTKGGPDIRLGRQLKAGLRLEWDAVVPTAAGEVVLKAGTVVRQ